MFQNIKSILFDLDGTLIDSMWMWKQIDIEFLGRFEISLPEDLQQKIEGMSFSETATYFKTRFNIPLSEEEMKAEWNKMAWDKYQNEVPLKPGVIEFLDWCQEKNMTMGIGTSNSRELAEVVLNELGVRQYFTSLRTACEVKQGKPSPDIYLKVAEDLQTPPEKCLVFEDVVSGIQAGKAAGMKTCAVYDSSCYDNEDEKRAAADYYIHSFEQLRGGK